LGYSLPKKYLTKIGVNSAQLTLSGQNLVTITKYTGLDPEFNNRSIYERGVDINAWPNIKSYSLGLQIGL
jgi:TonB-dependent starch-binding outer membrane protein SusC